MYRAPSLGRTRSSTNELVNELAIFVVTGVGIILYMNICVIKYTRMDSRKLLRRKNIGTLVSLLINESEFLTNERHEIGSISTPYGFVELNEGEREKVCVF